MTEKEKQFAIMSVPCPAHSNLLLKQQVECQKYEYQK